ncbi:MAG TPA: hypothetical protein VGD58_08585 [Herpetosiphonaceae bacterium]
MKITTPTEIKDVAWEGELEAPAVSYAPSSSSRPVVTIGQPEIWTAADALENEVGKKWVPPIGGASYWLLRLACTLREPAGRERITEAQQTLYLLPQNRGAPDSATYAYSLFPDRLSVEDKTDFNVSLGPELSFASGAGFKLGELGATIEYRKVFPVIQSFGAGEPSPYWRFQPHAAHPLVGSQFVYAVVVARPGVDAIRATVELTVTVETRFGPVRFGTPREEKPQLTFTIPPAP